jgi:hypothetical protein
LDGALGSMLEYLSFKSEIDLVFSPSILTKEPQVKDFQGIHFEPKEFRGRELYSFYRPHPALSATVDVCLAMLFSRRFLKTSDIEFTEGMSFLEDGAFIAKSFSVAKKSLLQWNPFYQLRVHPSSTSQQMKIYDYQALEGHFKGIASLKDFSLKNYGVENDPFLQGLIIKYSLLPYQSCIDTRGLDLKKHRWVHGKMKDLGFYPIQTNSGNAYLVMLARWLNVSVYYYYFRWWLRLMGIALKSRWIKNKN